MPGACCSDARRARRTRPFVKSIHAVVFRTALCSIGGPAGHADTVGVERELWSADPFAGVVSGDFLYGRGSFDDKCGIAVFAAAAMRLARAGVPLTRDVVLVFEADEEGGDYRIDLARREPLGQARRRL